MNDDALGLGCLTEPLVCAWSQNETNQRRQCNSKLCLSNSFGEQQRRCARTVCRGARRRGAAVTGGASTTCADDVFTAAWGLRRRHRCGPGVVLFLLLCSGGDSASCIPRVITDAASICHLMPGQRLHLGHELALSSLPCLNGRLSAQWAHLTRAWNSSHVTRGPPRVRRGNGAPVAGPGLHPRAARPVARRGRLRPFAATTRRGGARGGAGGREDRRMLLLFLSVTAGGPARSVLSAWWTRWGGRPSQRL